MSTAAAKMPQPRQPVNKYGVPLEPKDYESLEARWIDAEFAEVALLRRVSDHEGREQVLDRSRDCSGLHIPYFWPGDAYMFTCRIRRDNPEIEGGKAVQKYLFAKGDRNRLYIVPGTEPALLADAGMPIIITEGEFKTIALARLSCRDVDAQLFLPIGIGGVWNWKGKIGIVENSKGARVTEKGVIPDLDRIEWRGRRVLIAFDADLKKNESVSAARFMLSRELRSRGAEVGFLNWDARNGKGIDDWLGKHGPEPVLRAIEAVDFNRTTGWRVNLRRAEPKKDGSDGKIKPLLINADIALRTCPDWEGVFAFDEFGQRVRVIAPAPIGGEFPRDWADADDTKTAIWMQDKGIELGRDTVGMAIQSVAMDNPIHPLRDWLNVLTWDETPRVDTWLARYLGAADDNYTRMAGRWWLLSAVARVMEPGCQADHMLILEGPQGKGKSSALRILAGDEYFTDQIPDISTKDASLQLFGKWILEWGELESMGRSEVESVKSFVSRRVETLRRPYGKIPVDVPRQCIFSGSTNNAEYLKDSTGNRRFWPVRVGSINLKALAVDREQIWAEVVAMYRARMKWHPESEKWIEEAAQQAALRVEGDVWAEAVSIYAATRSEVRVELVLASMGIELKDMKQSDRQRVGRCLRILGFEPDRDDQNRRCFTKSEK